MERNPNESFAAYKERRAASNAEVKAYTRNLNHGAVGSREKYRDDMRKSGAMGRRIRAADALVAAWASKRVPKWGGDSDKHGAYTLVGRSVTVTPNGLRVATRRKWLGGISAQRGY